jgi:non-heme chloroperoxidase
MQIPSPLKPRPKGARKTKARPTETEERAEVRHGYFKTFDGTRLFYSLEGEGPPLIFCYGLVCSSLHWTYQIDYFRRGYQAVWFDYRGHHNSEVPADLNTLDIPTMAKDLEALLDELKIKEAVFLGHSMGVNVVLELCRRRPERVKAMVLANGTAKRPLETLFGMNVTQGLLSLLSKTYARSPKLVSALWSLQKNNPISKMIVTLGGFNPHLSAPEDIALYVNQVAEMDPGILIYLIQNYDNFDSAAWLHTLQTPTLIIAGENDHITPTDEQLLMKQLLPNSEIEIVKHGSHCPQMDLPDLVNLRIEKFLAKLKY